MYEPTDQRCRAPVWRAPCGRRLQSLALLVLFLLPGLAIGQTEREFEDVFWESVECQSALQVQAYLEQYPTGAYVAGARACLEGQLGLDRSARRLVQQGLTALDYEVGAADGLFGPATRAALRDWQAGKGFAATGYLTQEQAETLMAQGRHVAEARRRQQRQRRVGQTFSDALRSGGHGPQLVVVPAGSYQMGSPASEERRLNMEGPEHRVTIGQAFAVGVYEVTVGEYGRFVGATGHAGGTSCYVWEGGGWEARAGRSWRNPGFRQTERDPVVCVNWRDARAYVAWLSRETREAYRLPSEAEWEYVARARSTTARYWGESEAGQCRYANGADSSWASEGANCDDGHHRTAPVGSSRPNAFGLYDVLGNVWEWTQDCWNASYGGAPRDGRAWEGGECGRRVLRGGSWLSRPGVLRSANRGSGTAGIRDSDAGFRIARSLP